MEIMKIILTITESFFIIYLMCYAFLLVTSVIVGAISIYDKMQKNKFKNLIEVDEELRISIIIPAFNEEITIMNTIDSLAQLDYKNYEIVVVNDGSSDKTLDFLLENCQIERKDKYIQNHIKTKPIRAIYEGKYKGKNITVIDKENGGKADSLNVGINVSNYPWFICMDADSILQSDALKNVVVPILEDETVIASGGAIMISNGVT